MPIRTKRLLVDFRDDFAPAAHPQLTPYLAAGWQIQGIAYRLTRPATPKLLVSLVFPAAGAIRRAA